MKITNKPQRNHQRMRPPSSTPEGRENQLISMAIDLAAEQIFNGTASSQVITHFLKLGSMKEKKELEILDEQKKLMQAKTEAIQSAKRVEELYKNALDAMRTYSGNRGGQDD